MRSPVGVAGRGGHTGGQRNNGFGRGHRTGSQTGSERKPDQKASNTAINLDDYKNRLSAKEKTGVDPLSQVSRSLDDARNVTLRDAMTSQHNPQTYNSSSRSRTGHRNTPQTSELESFLSLTY